MTEKKKEDNGEKEERMVAFRVNPQEYSDLSVLAQKYAKREHWKKDTVPFMMKTMGLDLIDEAKARGDL